MLIRATGLTSTVHTEEKKVRVKASLQTTNMTTGQGLWAEPAVGFGRAVWYARAARRGRV